MPNRMKYDQILDALQTLMVNKNIQSISVQEIAQTAGIGKGSIYYYFSSKDDILKALIERNYKKPIDTAAKLAAQTDVSPFTRMALLLQACRDSSGEFNVQGDQTAPLDARERAYIQERYMQYIITELKPALTQIIQQGIDAGQIHFEYPAALAEIVLIVLTTKLSRFLVPSTPQETEESILALISLLEKGTENPPGSLNFLKL